MDQVDGAKVLLLAAKTGKNSSCLSRVNSFQELKGRRGCATSHSSLKFFLQLLEFAHGDADAHIRGGSPCMLSRAPYHPGTLTCSPWGTRSAFCLESHHKLDISTCVCPALLLSSNSALPSHAGLRSPQTWCFPQKDYKDFPHKKITLEAASDKPINHSCHQTLPPAFKPTPGSSLWLSVSSKNAKICWGSGL